MTWAEYREELERIRATQIYEFNLEMQVRNSYHKNADGYVVRSWEDKSIESTNSIDSKAAKARAAALAALLATPANERGAR